MKGRGAGIMRSPGSTNCQIAALVISFEHYVYVVRPGTERRHPGDSPTTPDHKDWHHSCHRDWSPLRELLLLIGWVDKYRNKHRIDDDITGYREREVPVDGRDEFCLHAQWVSEIREFSFGLRPEHTSYRLALLWLSLSRSLSLSSRAIDVAP